VEFNGHPALSDGYIADRLETNNSLANLNSGFSSWFPSSASRGGLLSRTSEHAAKVSRLEQLSILPKMTGALNRQTAQGCLGLGS
jgi:hypothetical protein